MTLMYVVPEGYRSCVSLLANSFLLKFSKLAEDNVSGGFSGAELVGACRDAALLALEEEEALENLSIIPRIGMKHMVKALESMEKQITPGMIDFYMQYQGKRK